MCHDTLIRHHITLKVAFRQLRRIRPTTSQERFVGGTATETEKKQGAEEEHRTSNGCRSEGSNGRGSASCTVHVTHKVLWRRRDEEQDNWVIGAIEGQTQLLAPSSTSNTITASLSEVSPYPRLSLGGGTKRSRRWPTLADGGLSRMTSVPASHWQAAKTPSTPDGRKKKTS